MTEVVEWLSEDDNMQNTSNHMSFTCLDFYISPLLVGILLDTNLRFLIWHFNVLIFFPDQVGEAFFFSIFHDSYANWLVQRTKQQQQQLMLMQPSCLCDKNNSSRWYEHFCGILKVWRSDTGNDGL